jgi:hypothetical protein
MMICKVQVVTLDEDGREEIREIARTGADRFEAGDAGADLGRSQSHPQGGYKQSWSKGR